MDEPGFEPSTLSFGLMIDWHIIPLSHHDSVLLQNFIINSEQRVLLRLCGWTWTNWNKYSYVQQTLTSRQTNFKIIWSNNYKIGNNLLCNSLQILDSKIPLLWLNLSLKSFRVNCKKLLMWLHWQFRLTIFGGAPSKFYITLLTNL